MTLRLRGGPDRPALSFRFEGREIAAREGDTLAAALTAAGEPSLMEGRDGRPAGVFCGIGLCWRCLVDVDGRQGERACMTRAVAGCDMRRHRDGAPAPAPARLAPMPQGETPRHACDVAVVGGGPAGVAAALAAARTGRAVRLIDERAAPGGQYFKPQIGRRDAQGRAGEALRAELAASAATVMTGATVWTAERVEGGFRLGLIGPDGAATLQAPALILALGAYERAPLIPGAALPGVMTVGAGQTLVRAGGVAPGRRTLIACEGPLGLHLAAELVAGGLPPVAVLERARPFSRPGRAARAALAGPALALRAAGYRARLLAAGVPVLEGWELTALEGCARVETAVAAPVGGGPARRFAVDAVCLNEGFPAQTDLAALLGVPMADGPHGPVPARLSGDGLWIVGDGAGLGGAEAALAAGALAGAEAAGAPPPPGAAARLARARAFQRSLWALYAAPPRAAAPDDAALCRCEGVGVGAVRSAIAAGARDVGAVKRATRLGMGRCQGRNCAAAAARLLAEAGLPQPPGRLMAPQSPARPVPAAALAREKPEWAGHRRAEPLARPAEDPGPPPPPRADIAIVGGGVMGLAAALRAADMGLHVVLLERGALHAEASGGNAGSLHLQLLSFDFGEKALDRGAALLDTLPLQRDSVALWAELERELGGDFGIARTGGLMLAEDPAQIAFLERKAAAERSVGIDVRVIGPAEIAAIAPSVADRFVAAAWAPDEGKIDPLAAGVALASAARARGATLLEGATVTGLSREGADYVVSTPAGALRAPRLVLAAGGWTARLAAMLGVRLPVSGAPLQMVVTECAPPLAPCLLAHAGRRLTMKQAAAGNLIIGGAWTAATHPATGRTRVIPESLEGNLWAAERVLPAVAGLRVIRAWAAMNVDIDGAPLIGPLPGLPGAVAVASANGYTLGPLLGRAAAEIAVEGRAPQTLARFAPDRFAATV